MKNSIYVLCFLMLFFSSKGYSQNTQTIKGVVIDQTNLQTIPGANIFYEDENGEVKGASSDFDGKFSLTNVSVGRHIIKCTFIGYEPWISGNIEVTSAKEIVLSIELAPSVFTTDEVVVVADKIGGSTNNEFTKVSGRSFSSEETQRFAGSINDPGRMGLSMPGVQVSNQDNQNTMVVRANAPFGLMWRLEGMEMPNPNHFADLGTSGGGISSLSIFVLGESDFLNGSFAAEYGNATSGIVDMHFRKGNTENHEHRFQIGVIGIDFASEGPISKKENSGSYLINYRYSTLGLLSKMGIRVVNPNVDNVFQDLSFNLYFPLSKKTFLNIYGLGGLSLESKDADPDGDRYVDWRTYSFPTNLGTTGATVTHLIDNKSYLYTAIGIGGNYVEWKNDTTSMGNSFRIEDQYYKSSLVTGTVQYNRQPSKRLNTKTGLYLTRYGYDVSNKYYDQSYDKEILLYEGLDHALMTEVFSQGIFKASKTVDLQFGLHAQHLSSTKDFALEPRLGATFNINRNSTLSLSYGNHSRMLPWSYYNTKIYNDVNQTYSAPNEDLGFIRATHYTVMFNQNFANKIRLKIEPFYQYLYDVPVSTNPNSTFSMLNEEPDFYSEVMENTGEGRNYGIESTLEKFFDNQLFFILNGSVFNSEYKMNNGGLDEWFGTRYNTKFSGSFTTGKEWNLSNGRRLEAGGRLIYSKGMKFSQIDTNLSQETGRIIYQQTNPYSEQLKDYMRMDLRMAFRKNTEKRSWRLSLDIQNATNRENIRRPYYDRRQGNIGYDLQSSLVPALSYILDF